MNMLGTVFSQQQKILATLSKPVLPIQTRTSQLRFKLARAHGDIEGYELDRALKFQLKQAQAELATRNGNGNVNGKTQSVENNEELIKVVKEWIQEYEKTHSPSSQSNVVQHELKERAQQLIAQSERKGLEEQLKQTREEENSLQNGHPRKGKSLGPVVLENVSMLFDLDVWEDDCDDSDDDCC